MSHRSPAAVNPKLTIDTAESSTPHSTVVGQQPVTAIPEHIGTQTVFRRCLAATHHVVLKELNERTFLNTWVQNITKIPMSARCQKTHGNKQTILSQDSNGKIKNYQRAYYTDNRAEK
ncbi:hypothetical protein B9J09_00165 [Xylella fastidiosa subsp. pauca]|uniref:hypothetical protein n=1 Tax=Xylella fastidiosa TaxID=2371 RepID=UPI0009B9F873|nr:hypothetical protein [Xylella fastidiosa]ARO67710.1 hypothetical protein B9J09_00165 [Xylella fastidiosa subsp. pauca]TNW22524.1 hypothetical protein EIP73_06015 [Xylella fastidiosa subsp. pauca]TNW26507.1 hypothetical protein EIP74_09615 [Xylella fastidiosa subsp. pauca]